MANKKGKTTPVTDRTIFDLKCTTCGVWMQRTVNTGRNGIRSSTNFCPECGLSSTVDE
jgi:hypothetical protein